MRNKNIKICISILAILSIALCMFQGCSDNQTGDVTPSPYDNTGSPELEMMSTDEPQETETVSPITTENTEYKAKITRVTYTGEPLAPIIVTSYEQWESLTAYNTLESTEERVLQPLSAFDEVTFKDSVLIVGEIVTNTGSAQVEVASVDSTADPIVVSMKVVIPELATQDMAQHRIFIVLPRTMYEDQAEVIFDYNGTGTIADS